MSEIIDAILRLLPAEEITFERVLFLLVFVFVDRLYYRQYKNMQEDRQKEIDRLAEDNRDYRNRFLYFIDKKMGYNENKNKEENRK